MKRFSCAIFLDDDSIVEGVREAKSDSDAVSRLLSDEAIKRKTFYSSLIRHVLNNGCLAKEI